MMVQGKNPRRVRGGDRNDRWMFIAAVAVWGVVTGSMAMRADRSVVADPLHSARSPGVTAQPVADGDPGSVTAAEHLQLVREAVADPR